MSVAVEREHVGELRAAEPQDRIRDRVEHRLHIGLRPADHAQDVAGRRLLLERFGEVAVARLELLEQPHVLDRDDRLVGEGLQQCDLRIRKRPRHVAINGDRADGLPSRSMRHGKDAAESGALDVLVT